MTYNEEHCSNHYSFHLYIKILGNYIGNGFSVHICRVTHTHTHTQNTIIVNFKKTTTRAIFFHIAH